MTKIYNEVVIDMNPESDYYGETLHEDAFEYDGPMALAVVLNTGEDWHYGNTNLGQYSDWHKDIEVNGERFYVMETGGGANWGATGGSPKFVIVDSAGDGVGFGAKGAVQNNYGNAGGGWHKWATDVITQSPTHGTAAKEEREGQTIETAPSLKYSEFSKYLDPTTGSVTDVQGMVDYLQTHGMENMSQPEIMDALSNMPGLNVNASDIASAKAKQQSDIYGLQSGMMQERGKAITQAGVSGIYSPTSTGFGGGDMSDSYSKLAGVSQYEGGDVYGLAGGKEEELLNWIKDFTT